MSNKIKVKVNLPEFTYKDKKGYHTVVSYGEVPPDNQEVQTAIQKKLIVPILNAPQKSENENKKSKSRRSLKNKED